MIIIMNKIFYYFNNHKFNNLDDFKEYIETNTIVKGSYYIFRFYTNEKNTITLSLQSYEKIFSMILNKYTYMEINENIDEIRNNIKNLKLISEI